MIIESLIGPKIPKLGNLQLNCFCNCYRLPWEALLSTVRGCYSQAATQGALVTIQYWVPLGIKPRTLFASRAGGLTTTQPNYIFN